jgi:hypothetical protein
MRHDHLVDIAPLGRPPSFPPPTIVEVLSLFDDDIAEIDSVFYAPVKK